MEKKLQVMCYNWFLVCFTNYMAKVENKFELSQISIFKLVVHFCVVFMPEEERKFC